MARYTKEIDLVVCAKLGEDLPAMPRPPFPGELGERIYNNISAYAYAQWSQQASMVINHYGLNMADPRSHEFLFEQMEAFFFGGGQGTAIQGAPVGGKGTPRK